MEQKTTQKANKSKAFVSFVIERMRQDTGFGAVLRRADNPATEYQAWEHLASWCDDLEDARERHAFATVAAALARSKPERDGTLGIGRAIAESYREGKKDGNQSDSAKLKLRRLLACNSTEEACAILRPMLSFVSSKGPKIDHGLLLNQLLYFGERVKVRWASDFYDKKEAEV